MNWHLGIPRLRGALPVRRELKTLALIVFALAGAFGSRTTEAQNTPATAPRQTLVEVILYAADNAAAIQAQNWRTVFESLELELQIKQPILDDKVELTERSLGRLRVVTAKGGLRRDGSIEFPNRVFTTADREKLKKWIEELKVYGAQGSPDGQPLWGLTQQQFNELLTKLTPTVSESLVGLGLLDAVSKIGLDDSCPIRWTEEALKLLEKRTDPTVVQYVRSGFSRGITLAWLLNEFGLSYQPVRTPTGGIVLDVIPSEPERLVWPLGWPLEARRNEAAPKLFDIQTIVVDNLLLTELADRIGKETGVTVGLDVAEISRLGVDLKTYRVNAVPKKTTWSLVLRQVIASKKLTRELWQDEAGHPFLWVTSTEPARRITIDREGAAGTPDTR